jgi:hypothetical protein
MDDNTVLAIVGIVLTAISLVVAYWTINRKKPNLFVEVAECKHGIGRAGDAFLLQLNYQLYNTGGKNTTVTGLEVSLVDGLGNLQNQTITLKQDVGAGENPVKFVVWFSFASPFPYDQRIECHFVLYHTYGEKVFVANSSQSDFTRSKDGIFD